jgi:hypothetical protein
MYLYTHIHTHARKHPTIHSIKHLWNTQENIYSLALLTHPSTLPSKWYIEIYTCIHTYTHTHASIQLLIIKHLWNTHVKTYVHSHFWLILLLYHTSDTWTYVHMMYTHIHTHTHEHPTIHYQAPMKHTCKNICALALLTHPSTLPHWHKRYI